MSINTEINRLLNFAKQNMLINEDDYYYAANRLLDVLKVDAFEPEFVDEKLPTAMPILENMLDYAAEKGLIENTTENRDLFDTRIMDCVMPRPSEVVRRFTNDYARSPKAATDEFYKMSIASNYIRKDRIDKNIVWKTATEYGDLDITINLSKPEKDPRDIAKAKLAPSSGYPKCLLCRENEGYAGHPGHPARETHRLIPLRLSAHRWFLQYSPYTYYNEHCIVLNRKHVPMKVSRKSFENLLDFVTIFPHYFLGSNADLPIVGGSILSHDHYQGGRYTFAMAKAPIEKFYTFPGFEDIKVGRVKWPMSTIRLQGEDREELATSPRRFSMHGASTATRASRFSLRQTARRTTRSRRSRAAAAISTSSTSCCATTARRKSIRSASSIRMPKCITSRKRTSASSRSWVSLCCRPASRRRWLASARSSSRARRISRA